MNKTGEAHKIKLIWIQVICNIVDSFTNLKQTGSLIANVEPNLDKHKSNEQESKI